MRSENERVLSQRWRKDGLTYTEIGRLLGTTRYAAANLCRYKRRAIKKKSGPMPILSYRDRWAINKIIQEKNQNNEKVNSTILKRECGLDCSTRTLRRYLIRRDMKYAKASMEIKLSKKDKVFRMNVISAWIESNIDWQNVVFSDEKCFSLDGPSHWMSYIHQGTKLIRQRRHSRGGSLMVWLYCMSNGLLGFKFVNGSLKSKDYKEFLSESLIRIANANIGPKFLIQQDNAPVHRSKLIQNFVSEHNIKVIQWPPRSPDLNIVENIWKMLSDHIYVGNQFSNISELRVTITNSIHYFNETRRADIISLYEKFRHRLTHVLRSNGNLFNKL